MKVDPSGNEIWGTLLGGPASDTATALAIDANGNVAFTGSTGGQFSTTPGAAIESSTSAKVFAAMVTADGSKFLYSTYLPESLAASSSVAVDAAGNAYIAGKTSVGRAFVLKLSPDGSTITYNVILGARSADAITAIAADSAGNAIVAGQTTSPDFPVTAGASQQHLKGIRNCFLVRLDPAGQHILRRERVRQPVVHGRRQRWQYRSRRILFVDASAENLYQPQIGATIAVK